MIAKTTLIRRKRKGFLKIVFLCLLLFIVVFGVCFGIWWCSMHTRLLQSPLAKADISKNGTFEAKIESYCGEFHLSCTAINPQPDGSMDVTLDTDEHVIFSPQKDLHDQFTSLQLTIGHLTIEGKRFHRLDFRFDKPVLSY